jgi:hypothetical protein
MPPSLRLLRPLAALLVLAIAACTPRVEETPGFQAACHGGVLTLEQHEQALTDGYAVHPRYRCIEKESYEAEQVRRAEYAAANTPEAKAQRAAERAEQTARDTVERERRERERARRSTSARSRPISRAPNAWLR